MNASRVLILWIAFFVLCPVLNISGHFIYPPELFIYSLFFWKLFFSNNSGDKQEDFNNHATQSNGVLTAHIIYILLFSVTAMLTAYMAGQSVNNYDFYIFRNILQVIICIKLFDEKLKQLIVDSKFELTIFVLLIILAVPAFIVYLQLLNIFSMRDLVIDLYKPQFFFLDAKSFATYRYTSVFKDFFTSAIYYTILASFVFYFILKTKLNSAYRISLVVLLVIIYGAQLFVARTSLVMIPLAIGAVAIISSRLNMRTIIGRLVPIALLVSILGFIGIQQIIESGLVNQRWAMGALAFVDDASRSKVSSFTAMQEWNENFLKYINQNEQSLTKPSHNYDLTESKNPGIYTDSFYGQELYRYGIYGAISYLVFVFLFIMAGWKQSRYLFVLAVMLFITNIKGGNTFFMPKNIYLYALILSVVRYTEHMTSTINKKIISTESKTPFETFSRDSVLVARCANISLLQSKQSVGSTVLQKSNLKKSQ